MNDYSFNKKKGVYVCKKCKRETNFLSDMWAHIKEAHQINTKVKIEPKGKKGYKTTVTTKKAK
jgi:hypothetical protein